MPDLLEHLYNLATGNVGRTRGAMSRNYASEPRFRTDPLPRTPPSTPPQPDRS